MNHYTQLIIGLTIALLFFTIILVSSPKTIIPILLVIAPFEIINSQYGSSSTGIIYIAVLVLIIRKNIVRIPLAWPIFLIMLAYGVSLALAEARIIDHAIYLIRLIPGFLLFIITYNYVIVERNVYIFFNLLLSINILVLAICTIQLVSGEQQVLLFGVSEFALKSNRASGRLSGPFGAEFTSEYLAMSTLILIYLLMKKKHWPYWSPLLLWSVIGLNIGSMVMTGTRGGILVLLLGLLAGLFKYQKEIGLAKSIFLLFSFTMIASLIGVAVLNYTDHNVLLDRLENTEIREGVIDSRSIVWPTAWEAIQNNPFFGHGPRLRLMDDLTTSIPGHEPIPYPHSLPLFLLYTLGIFGLLAYILFFTVLCIRMYAGGKSKHSELASASTLGLIVLSIFLLDEIKIEFLRLVQNDYQAIIFTILGGFLAIADLARSDPGLEAV